MAFTRLGREMLREGVHVARRTQDAFASWLHIQTVQTAGRGCAISHNVEIRNPNNVRRNCSAGAGVICGSGVAWFGVSA